MLKSKANFLKQKSRSCKFTKNNSQRVRAFAFTHATHTHASMHLHALSPFSVETSKFQALILLRCWSNSVSQQKNMKRLWKSVDSSSCSGLEASQKWIHWFYFGAGTQLNRFNGASTAEGVLDWSEPHTRSWKISHYSSFLNVWF